MANSDSKSKTNPLQLAANSQGKSKNRKVPRNNQLRPTPGKSLDNPASTLDNSQSCTDQSSSKYRDIYVGDFIIHETDFGGDIPGHATDGGFRYTVLRCRHREEVEGLENLIRLCKQEGRLKWVGTFEESLQRLTKPPERAIPWDSLTDAERERVIRGLRFRLENREAEIARFMETVNEELKSAQEALEKIA
jgi:hypothetical protein